MNTSGETPGKGLIFEANIDCIIILYTYVVYNIVCYTGNIRSDVKYFNNI